MFNLQQKSQRQLLIQKLATNLLDFQDDVNQSFEVEYQQKHYSIVKSNLNQPNNLYVKDLQLQIYQYQRVNGKLVMQLLYSLTVLNVQQRQASLKLKTETINSENDAFIIKFLNDCFYKILVDNPSVFLSGDFSKNTVNFLKVVTVKQAATPKHGVSKMKQTITISLAEHGYFKMNTTAIANPEITRTRFNSLFQNLAAEIEKQQSQQIDSSFGILQVDRLSKLNRIMFKLLWPGILNNHLITYSIK